VWAQQKVTIEENLSSVYDRQYYNVQAYYRITDWKGDRERFAAGEGIYFSFSKTSQTIEINGNTDGWVLYNSTILADLDGVRRVGCGANAFRSMTFVADFDDITVRKVDCYGQPPHMKGQDCKDIHDWFMAPEYQRNK